MSYSIFIGNAELDVAYDSDETPRIGAHVPGEALDDAPHFPGDTMTGQSNGRHPGYSQWTRFCEETGLQDLFFDKETGLMRAHPGCFALKPAHLARMEDALASWKSKHPGMIAGLDPSLKGTAAFTGEGGDPKYCANLARMEWLVWWTKRALATCKQPAIYNY